MPGDNISLVEESRVKGMRNQYKHSMGDGKDWNPTWEAEPGVKGGLEKAWMQSQPRLSLKRCVSSE